MVKFFAKYCKPCEETLPLAQRLHEQYDELLVVGVSEDELRSDVVATVQSFGLTFPVIHDRAKTIAGQFRVTELPATFLVDRSGYVRWVGRSSQDETILEAALRSLM